MVQGFTLALQASYETFGSMCESSHQDRMGGVIPYQTEIGEGTFFTYHALGVVINARTVIGKNCKIRQNVTMGANADGAPTLGDNVEVGAGAVIIGSVKIGNNVRIGANAFVNTDLPDNCTAVGLPAKPVKYF